MEEYEDTDETLQAGEYAHEASVLLMKLSETDIESYSLDSKNSENENIYSKKIGNVDIGRLELTIPSSSKYIDILRKIWDFNDHQKKDNKFIDGKVVRIYCNERMEEYEDTDETLQAGEYAHEASVLLMKLSETDIESYSLDSKNSENENIYSKKIGNVDIGRLELTIPSSSKYIDILRKIWDFNDHQKKDNKFID
ncbi:hypothetical protein PCHDK_000514900, partial [Plasmodium chabaudi adami]